MYCPVVIKAMKSVAVKRNALRECLLQNIEDQNVGPKRLIHEYFQEKIEMNNL
jgi:hypothetical protein